MPVLNKKSKPFYYTFSTSYWKYIYLISRLTVVYSLIDLDRRILVLYIAKSLRNFSLKNLQMQSLNFSPVT